MTDRPDPASPEPDWRELRRGLLAFVRSQLRDEAAAEDVVQDVLAAALEKAAQLRDPHALRSWLYAMARNRTIDGYRRSARRGRAMDALRRQVPAAASDGGEAEAEAEDVRSRLAACLGELVERQSPRDRDAIGLVDRAGHERRALAETLGLSPSGAKSRVQRARRKVREALERCCRPLRDGRGRVVDLAPKAPAEPVGAPGCCGSGGEPRCAGQ
jgi:RNA polymerase sigma-70 factor (ECF subfamily)